MFVRKSISFVTTVFFCLFFVSPVFALTSDDPYLDEQWYLDQVHAYEAWDYTIGSRSVTVAVLDTGLDFDHPDIVENIWTNPGEIPDDGIDNDGNGFIDDVHGWDFVEDDADPEPGTEHTFTLAGISHGTIIASVIGAVGNNAEGVAGINWQIKIMPVRILDTIGSGNSSDAARAVDYAVNNGAQVINLSFSGFEPDPALKNSIKNAYEAGVTVVAAVGNNDTIDGDYLDEVPIYPACYESSFGEDWVLGVAATNEYDARADFSNYGSCVDISAPGVNIFGAQFQDDAEPELEDYYGGGWEGTSAAAPIVSGSAALLLSLYPDLGVEGVRTVLQLSVDPAATQGTKYHGEMGAGRLNVGRALEIASGFVGSAVSTTESSLSLVVAPERDLAPNIKRFSLYAEELDSFNAYAETFTGGVRLAMGDVDGDGVDEIISGAGPGGGPQVRIFELDGTVIGQFFAYPEEYRAGIFVAVGDLTGDGVDEIVVGPGANERGKVKVFNYRGDERGAFFPFGINSSDIRVAAGDVDGDGVDEVIVGRGPGNSPMVKIFEGTGQSVSEFEAYASTYYSGIFVASGDVDGDGIDEIVTGTDDGGGPHVRVFDSVGSVIDSFFAYDEKFRGGVKVAVGDMNGDAKLEIITAAGVGGGPHVRIFSGTEPIAQFFAFDESFTGGINVGAWSL